MLPFLHVLEAVRIYWKKTSHQRGFFLFRKYGENTATLSQ